MDTKNTVATMMQPTTAMATIVVEPRTAALVEAVSVPMPHPPRPLSWSGVQHTAAAHEQAAIVQLGAREDDGVRVADLEGGANDGDTLADAATTAPVDGDGEGSGGVTLGVNDGDELGDGTKLGVADVIPMARKMASKRSLPPLMFARWTSHATMFVPILSIAFAVLSELYVRATTGSVTLLEALVEIRMVTSGMFSRPTSAPLM